VDANEYTANTKVESDYTANTVVASDYTANTKVESDYTANTVVASDYTANTKVASDYRLKKNAGITFKCICDLIGPYSMDCDESGMLYYEGRGLDHHLMSGEEPCPNQLVRTDVCNEVEQTYLCLGAKCGGNPSNCDDFVCTTEDQYCTMSGGSSTCQTGTTCDGSSSVGHFTVVTCKAGATCAGSASTEGVVTMYCEPGATCTGSASTNGVVTMNCEAGATCSGRASTGGTLTMNCAEGETCPCTTRVGGQCN
jgi:hypothetical protein